MNISSSGDIPQISNSAYVSSTITPDQFGLAKSTWTTGPHPWLMSMKDFMADQPISGSVARIAEAKYRYQSQQEGKNIDQIMNNETSPATPIRRIIQVFIADPNENAPLEHSVLYKGDTKLTDLTDTELFFEVPITELLKSHNEKRIKWLDKEASKRAGKEIYLEPVRIRELKMVVVTLVAF